MERLVIEELQGINTNAVEGVATAPARVSGLVFKRGGGYLARGVRDGGWLGGRVPLSLGTEAGFDLLLEGGSSLMSEYAPAQDLGATHWLAYDESELALLNGPNLWYGGELYALPSPAFDNEGSLALAPRSAVLAPWSGSLVGASFYRTPSGALSVGAGAGTAAFVENAGTGTPAGTYEFIWVVEAPTDGGLVVHAVGKGTQSPAVAVASIDITLSIIYPEGTVTRFYYRPANEPYFERFSVHVSDGTTAPTANLDVESLGTVYDPSEECIVNFAGGRVESHNGRMWGRAGDNPFVTFVGAEYVKRTGGYISIDGGVPSTVHLSAPIASAQMPMRVSGDYVEFAFQRIQVTRTTTDSAIVVPLFISAKTDYEMWGYLAWSPSSSSPTLQLVTFNTATSAIEWVANPLLDLSALSLGLSTGMSLDISNVDLKITLTTVSSSIACDVAVAIGGITTTFSSTSTPGVMWSSYAVAGATTFYVGTWGLASSMGNRALRINHAKAGNGAITVRLLADIEDYVSGLTWVSSSTPAETWTAVSLAVLVVETINVTPDPDVNPVTQPDLTLVYSSVGSVNRGRADNFLALSPLSSRKITALSSTPAGLLVFLESETFLARGDPALEFNVQRLSGTMGCDPGVIPARLGSLVAPIYKGEVYGVNLGGGDVDFGGSMVNISRTVWNPDDPFIQVMGDPLRNELVAITNAGRVYILDVIEQKWRNGVFDEAVNLRYLLTPDRNFGVVYNVAGFLEVVNDGAVGTPLMEWSALDAGDKNAMKLWRRVEVFTEGVGDGAPALTYTARSASETVSGIDKGEGRWVFTFKRGVVGPTLGMKFEFLGATGDLVIEPPIVVEYAPRYRQR